MMDIPSLMAMLQRINEQVPQFMLLLTALSYLFGIGLFLVALHKFKQYGEMRGGQNADLRTPIVFSIMATLLLFLPSTLQIGLMTLWNTSNPLAYAAEAGESGEMFKAVMHIVQVIGILSMVRGIVLLSKLGSQGNQQNVAAKGVTHLIAGILAVNIYGTWTTLMNSLGFTLT